MTFRVGQKVTMIEPWQEFFNPYPDVMFTTFGEIYTVRDILSVGGKGIGIRVFEIRNAAHRYRGRGILEQPFPASNFRPAVDRPTDISVFTKALKSTDRKVDA